ncbi:MAG: flagellar hook capping protein [Lachnospiraceae bacterium]|nr:flagellar hook capping protein [Lachnospiraceae bacterium]
MGVVQEVKDGKFVENNSAASLAEANKKKRTGNDSLDKDAFLQLLVAQMKYQDPLEPTSNTEYISQFATFSELEQMQNMSASMDLFRASSLVGQTVLLKVTDSEGRETTVQGNVDYVVYERNKAYLSVNGDLYSMDDLDTVADPTYLEAYRLGAEFLNILNKLPAIEHLTLADREKVEKLDKMYQDMNDYQKSFLTAEQVEKMNQYVKKMKDMVAVAEANKGDSDKDDAGKDDDGDEGGDK